MKSTLNFLKAWGYFAKVLVPKHKRKKLGPKIVDAVFLSYAKNSYAYRFLVIKSELLSIDVNTIVKFCDATFFESIFFMKTGVPQQLSFEIVSFTSGSIPEHVTNVGASASGSHPELNDQEEEVELRRSKRQKITKNFGSDFITF